MLEKVLIFFLFLGPLIFFHELGHFIFARLFGVRIETFSLGFGPKLLKIKRGDTTYAISLIPLGGYVKMFGEDSTEQDKIDPQERAKSFSHKGKAARFWIVFGGPLANFILAFIIFFFLVLGGERIPEMKFGAIDKTTKFYEIGLRSGDSLRKINGVSILNPTDMPVGENTQIETISVLRMGKEVDLKTEIKLSVFFEELKNYPSQLRKPILISKTGERFYISAYADRFEKDTTLDEIIQNAENALFLYTEKANGVFSLVQTIPIESGSTSDSIMKEIVRLGFYPLDLQIKTINMGEPADLAGLKGNDIVTKLNDEAVMSFNELRQKIQDSKAPEVSITAIRGQEEKSYRMKPVVKEIEGRTMKLIGVLSSVEFTEPNYIHTPSKGFFQSIPMAMMRTWDATVKTIEGFAKLMTNEVSLKSVGGPIAIAKVASDSFYASFSYFFQLMAIISINLGIINLFPIPVLDGGHIVFLFLEFVNRGKISRRKMEIAQQIGLSILLVLMVAALYNDILGA